MDLLCLPQFVLSAPHDGLKIKFSLVQAEFVFFKMNFEHLLLFALFTHEQLLSLMNNVVIHCE